MKETWKEVVHRQRISLAEQLRTPLGRLAELSADVWGDREALNIVLSGHFDKIPYCMFLYAVDTQSIQASDNFCQQGLMPGHYGRDRGHRPYMREAVPAWGFLLSDAYLSQRANRPSVTALQVIRRGDETVGFIGADFDLRDLPVTSEHYEESNQWRQIKGDPAIRGTVFQQCRIDSQMDSNMESAIAILEDLITERGLFQAVVHFSSSRATAWFLDDPYRYRILDAEVLSDPDICMLYPRRPYPDNAMIPQEIIPTILSNMRQLRTADETLYLRMASINIFNGMISLTFSCDGSHYMSWQEFLDKDMTFWLGSAA